MKRSLSTKEVVSHEIVSGNRKSALADGSFIELGFSNFLMIAAVEVESPSCDPADDK